MTHEEASPHVSDWARGQLAGEKAAAIERHVGTCRECRDAADAARALATEAARVGAAANAHPSTDALARYVTTPDDEPIASLAQVAVHLHDCDPCRDDVALMREASVPAWWRSMRAWAGAMRFPSRMLQPALATAALVLIVPAWIGIVEAPRDRAESERLRRTAEEGRAQAETRALEVAARADQAQQGGGVAALVLRGATRAGTENPTLRLREGQTLQPLLLDVVPRQDGIVVRVVREGGGEIWSASGPREAFWDESNQLVGVLVPVARLSPGHYRVELASSPSVAPFFSSSFQVVAGAVSPR